MAGSFGKRGAQPVRTFAPPSARLAAAAPSASFNSTREMLAAPPPVVAPSKAAAEIEAAIPTIRVPVVTIGLLVLLTVIYVMEVRYSPSHGFLSAGTLAEYGAIQGSLVFQQWEVWRLFTAPMLHASTGHLIGNGVVLAIVGFSLEPLIGQRWFAGLYVIGGLGGTIVSLLLNDQTIPSVGASGAIMGVLGAAFICGASAKGGPKGRKMQTRALWLILPALIPMAADSHTDFAGHLGGVVAGIVVGFVMLAAWERGADRPAMGNGAAAIGAVGILLGLLSFAFFSGHPANAAVIENSTNGMIPEDRMPASFDVGTDRARELLEKYPNDPRAHLFRGFAFLKHDHDLADAEEQLRQALADRKAVAQLAPEFEKTVTVILSLTVAYQGRPDQARALGNPHCGFAERSLGDLYDNMQEKGICP